MENEWLELDKLLNRLEIAVQIEEEEDLESYENHIKNYVQKERVLAKIKENHNWCLYFQSKEVNLPDMVKHFAAMNIKLESLLTRFP